eukprot:scaffold31373_cov53-Phaeocystis_antarctica.AAC.1
MGVVDRAVHTSPSIDRAWSRTLATSVENKLPLTAGNESAQYSAESVVSRVNTADRSLRNESKLKVVDVVEDVIAESRASKVCTRFWRSSSSPTEQPGMLLKARVTAEVDIRRSNVLRIGCL